MEFLNWFRERLSHWRSYKREIVLVLLVVLIVSWAGYIAGRIAIGRVKEDIQGYLQGALGVRLDVQRVYVTPWLQVVLENVRAVDAVPGEALPLVEAARVVLFPRFEAMIRGKIGLRGVFLEQPKLYLRLDESGEINIKEWLKGAVDCDAAAFGTMPDRVNIEGGAVLIEPPDWEDTDEFVKVDEISGAVGKGRGREMVVALSGRGAPGLVSAEGFFAPCAGGNVMLKFSSDKFDFNSMVDIFGRFTRETDEGWKKFSMGNGGLEMELAGGNRSPVLQGKISSKGMSAGFVYTGSALELTELVRRGSVGKVTGGGTIDFMSANLPMKFSFVLENWKVSRLFRSMLGYQFAPHGILTGYINMRGSLNDLDSMYQSGNIEIGAGRIFFPPPVFSEYGQGLEGKESLGFKKLSSNVIVEGSEVRLIGIKLDGEGFELHGRGKLSGGKDFAEVWGRDAQFETSVEFAADQVGDVLASLPSVSGLMEGRLEGTLRVDGNASSVSSIRGIGRLTVSKGWIRNPYGWADTTSGTRIDFDNINVEFNIINGAIRLNRLTLSGNGVYIEMSGEIAFGGGLSLTGQAEVAGDMARDFTGIANSVEWSKLTSAVMLKSPFSIGGSFQSPVMRWGQAREM
ncbi:MAG: AsmA-like C-terminal region-containing protein [bacterium]